jgi:hypothetical protein
MNAFLVTFAPGCDEARRWVGDLKSYSRSRELMEGVWLVISTKSASQIHDSLVQTRRGSADYPLTIFQVDGRGLDWHLSAAIKDEAKKWLFENLSHDFPAIRKK